MFFKPLAIASCLFGVASAHFRLLYPEPRGQFVADQEPNYCGGYTQVTTNRTVFPLKGGFFSIRSGHPDFSVGVLLSTAQNPTSFDAFKEGGVSTGQDIWARNLVKEPTAGTFCIPLDLSGVEGVANGTNVTIQVVVNGGDGQLYQCADLTISSAITSPPAEATCQNATATTSAHGTGTGTGAHTSATAPTGGAAGFDHQISAYLAGLFSVASIAAALI